MPISPLLRLNLQRLVLAVVVLTAIAMLATAFRATYHVQRQVLMDNALESNHAYAAKLAETTDGLLSSARQQLAHSAQVLGANFNDDLTLDRETKRLWLQTDTFNAVGVTDARGVRRATVPPQPHIKGQITVSEGSQQALEERLPLISPPYLSPQGNLIVFLSHPIYAPDGDYKGYIGGAIYLKQQNILNSLLGKHYYRDGSYIYVVDRTRRLLYHPDPARIGTVVLENTVIDQVLQGYSGSDQVTNSTGTHMLAGYAPVPVTGWGIVAQRPVVATLAPLSGLMRKTVAQTLPIALLALLGAWALAHFIARPLSLLARQAHELDTPLAPDRIQGVRSWYYEAAELKRAILIGVGLLHQKLGAANLDAQTDPLTGLINRRGLALALESLQLLQRPFAVLALDIDHFKRVNDTYGHDMGDLVLKKVAEVMRRESRPTDLLCRNGGEEFLTVLPETSIDSAVSIAERIRRQIASSDMPHGEPLTISIGVSHWPSMHPSIEEVIKQADQALYQAKQAGRNRVTRVHSDSDVA